MSTDVQQYAVNDHIMRIYDSANNDAYVYIKRACAHISSSLYIETCILVNIDAQKYNKA